MSTDWQYPHVDTTAGRQYLPSPEPVYVDARLVKDLRDERDRARESAAFRDDLIAEAVRVLESADPSCPGAAIQQALAVLDPGA